MTVKEWAKKRMEEMPPEKWKALFEKAIIRQLKRDIIIKK